MMRSAIRKTLLPSTKTATPSRPIDAEIGRRSQVCRRRRRRSSLAAIFVTLGISSSAPIAEPFSLSTPPTTFDASVATVAVLPQKLQGERRGTRLQLSICCFFGYLHTSDERISMLSKVEGYWSPQYEVHAGANEDIRRQLKIKPLVQIDMPVDENVKWAVTNRMCPACKHPELEYTNKQLRSADEGQTTFYRCPECGHNFNENS